MKKKLLTGIVGAFCVTSMLFGLTACNNPAEILGNLIGGLHTHDYTQKVVEDAFLESEATCEKKATYYYSCACGEKGTSVFENGEYAVHDWEEGKCSVCQADYYSEGLAYEVSADGSYYIVAGLGRCTDTDLVIPAMYDGKPVKVIGGDAFYKANALTSVVISNGVTSIRDYAFAGCLNLKSIAIPDSVIEIGYEAVSWCGVLTDVTFGENSKLTTIGRQAFSYCTSLKNINMPSSVISVGGFAFDECNNLQYTVEGNCKYLGNNNNPYVYLAGTTANDITSATINANCRVIGGRAFNWHKKLKQIVIPDSVVSIGDAAFNYCSSLTKVTFGEGSKLMSIGTSAFYNCEKLASIEIPKGVTSIAENVFKYCEDLTSVTFKDTNNWYRTTDYTHWQNKEGGTAMDVTNPSTNVTYFVNNSYDYTYWYKL